MSATNREIAVLTNDCYRKLDDDYLFYRIAGRIKKYSENIIDIICDNNSFGINNSANIEKT